MTLAWLPGLLAVCRLDAAGSVPDWAWVGQLSAVIRTDDGLSIVADQAAIPAEVEADRGWRALRVDGPLDLAMVGVLASLAGPLAHAGVAVFVVSSFETDFVLVKGEDRGRAGEALRAAGHEVR